MVASKIESAKVASDHSHYNVMIIEPGKGLVAKSEHHSSNTFATLPHPWHIEVSDACSNDSDVYQTLVNLHTRSEIKSGDIITGTKHSSLTNVSYIAKIFAGEYDVSESKLPNEQVQQTLTRVSSAINANIRQDLPRCPEELAAELKKHGHLLVRSGMAIDEKHLLNLFGHGKAMDYRYGNTARKHIKDSNSLKVTAWPKELMLPAHNEMTYHIEFPQNVAFLCKEPSAYGGETSIYDCAEAFKNLSPDMQEKVTRHDVVCRKRYVEQEDHSCYPSWQQVLGKGTSCEDITKHFVAIGYQCQQLQENDQNSKTTIVETSLTRPMVYRYGDGLCLHASMFPLTPYWYGQLWPDKVPPLMATWDNGEPITPEEFHELHDAMLMARIRYGGWQKHDVLILDNPRIAHGRLPFIGDRAIGVLMNKPMRFTIINGQWQVVCQSSEMDDTGLV